MVDRHQQTEIPLVTVTVTQYDQHAVRCRCGKVHTAPRPDGARSGPVGYGPNLMAWCVYLMVVHHIPVARCVELLTSLTGAAPSAGFVHCLIGRAAAALTGERKARLLLEFLQRRDADVLRFLTNLDIPPTSNDAERAPRPSKIQQNISGRLTSETVTQDRYTILGYLITAARHGLAMMSTLREAIAGRPWMPSLPAPT